jgi:hypothetical protein
MNRRISSPAIAVTAWLAVSCSGSGSTSYGSPTVSNSGSGATGGCSGTTPVSLTVKNFSSWCSVSVAGAAASSAATQTMCVAAGAVDLSATANATFVLGPTPWHDTAGDTGSGDPGTVTGSGQAAQSATTVTVSGASACVSVCCPGATGTPACPTTSQCP